MNSRTCGATPHPRPRERALLASDPATREGAWREGRDCARTSLRHCERSEAIHAATQRKNGWLRRFTPLRKRFAFVAGNDDNTQLHDLAACFARGLACSYRPLNSEGAGNAGRPMRPIAACAMSVVERTRVSQVTPESPGIPRAMVLTVSFVLSPVIGLFCHRRRRELLPPT